MVLDPHVGVGAEESADLQGLRPGRRRGRPGDGLNRVAAGRLLGPRVRRKGERQTRANAQRAAKGGVPKGVRLTGYTTDGDVVQDEAAVVRALFDGFATGLTLRTLSREHGMTPSTIRTIATEVS